MPMLVLLLSLSALAAPGTPLVSPPAVVSEAMVMMVGPAHGCPTRFQVDARGQPTEVEVRACPSALVEVVRVAALDWRFEPLVQDGQALAFRYVGTVPVVPPPLQLAGMEGLSPIEALATPDTAPVARKPPRARASLALQREIAAQGRRFAWESCSLRLRVDPQGTVSAAAPLRCPAILWPAAERAAFKARYDPATTKGQAVASVVELTLVYSRMP